MIDRGVTITLNADQAIVLSDWLDRVIGSERFDSFIDEDAAVWSPLYQLSGTLETTLPEIFAADYTARLDAARRRLLPTLKGRSETPSRRPTSVKPTGGPTPSPTHRDNPADAATRHVSGWIHEDHVAELLGWVAGYIGYAYDQFDEQALIGALDTTDDEADQWFEYPLLGSPAITVRLARSPGSVAVMTELYGHLDDVLAARIDTLIAVLASRR